MGMVAERGERRMETASKEKGRRGEKVTKTFISFLGILGFIGIVAVAAIFIGISVGDFIKDFFSTA